MRHTRSQRQTLAALLLSLSILFGATPGAASAQTRAPRPRTPAATPAPAAPNAQPDAPRPKLVLLVVVDQFRYDFLERFGDLFAANGLRRLMREGGSWTNANYDHMPTETAPGHATLMTGAWPSESGIIGNEWFDRDAGKRISNVVDESLRLFGGGSDEKASSPHLLLASTVGDELRLATNGRSKVVGISIKDRAAILPAGRHANAAYWYSTQTGAMVSSSYYFNQLPAWVARFNDAHPSDKFFRTRWERLLPEAEYLRRAGADDAAWENVGADRDKDTRTFPHNPSGAAQSPDKDFYDALQTSPFANQLLVDFAQQAVVNESLGADEDTDVLSVSFSANDYVGHRFGPYSQEVMDMTLRVDRQIAQLLDFLDARVGLRNMVVVFTGDHGVAPVPEHAVQLGLPGARMKPADVLTAIKNAIRARYGSGDKSPDKKDKTDDYIQDFTAKNGNVYFNMAALRRDGVRLEEIERVAGEAAMTVPGVSRYFTRTQLVGGSISPADAVARRVLHGFNARRSGDVVIVNESFHLVVTYTADHYSPYSYDTHVPLIIMGGGVQAGRYTEPAAPSDIAPTLASILRVQTPSNATGRILAEGLRPRAEAVSR